MKRIRKYSPAVDDSELVTLYKNGEESAFEELLFRHKSKVYTAILMVVKNREIAEDLLQETFIKAVKTIKSGMYNEEGKFLPWISRIAHNIAIDYFRRGKRYPSVQLEDNRNHEGHLLYDIPTDSCEEIRIKEETRAQLRALIDTLPDAQREVLIMRQYMGMSFQEIAEITGVSINTALGRMRYALINLKRQLDSKNIHHAVEEHFSR
ncbi:MAG: sigma-70 family RNA polymerase sigma factor [Cytophagales bacterium]|nr:sigma-70 family RNA polymerase sigma factor [Cytophagales bacterium]MDW8385169.1 sigma-70 family RNA polymerase sigma factor [Flammeovirgaceae bacterium]